MKRIQERILQIPHELRPLSLGLAKRGWYINMDMPLQFLFRLRHVLDAGKVDEVDAYMAAYLRHQHETLTAGISETFPARSTVLNAAFEAHRREEYVLSVPIFLAQSDGICEELLGAGFYSRFKGIPKTHSLVQKFKGDAIILALLEPLKVAGALNAYESERHQYPDVLNRHEVLHGKSSDYATELNSFRSCHC